MKHTEPKISRRRFLKRCLIGGAALAVPADAILYEPRAVELTTHHVAVPNLPRERDGFRLVQLSDLHRRSLAPDAAITSAVRIANSTRPDAAVLTGDFIHHNPDDIVPCFEMLSELKSTLGSYAVFGNHDHWTDAPAVAAAMKRHGVTLLDNANVELEKGLYLVGIDDKWGGRPDVPTSFRQVNRNSSHVILSHTPLAVDLLKGRCGLLITGHTHGGQINIPFVPRSCLPGLRGWKYISGWYRVDQMLMYVNRGIGMVNPPIRFLCRPEVTLFILHPASTGLPHLASARINNPAS